MNSEEQEIISRIIKLESEILSHFFNNKNLRPNDDDQFKQHRIELKQLREKVAHIIYPKSCLKGGDPQKTPRN